ncbi:hypothetical protein JCM8202_001224 [Rhodotorula sphaerocarpa]
MPILSLRTRISHTLSANAALRLAPRVPLSRPRLAFPGAIGVASTTFAAPRAFASARPLLGPIHEKKVEQLAQKIPDNFLINLGQIMADLRDLELLDLLNGTSPKSGSGYKDATRALYPLFYRYEENSVVCSFSDLQEALPPLYGLAWTAISERLLAGKISKLEALDPKRKAALQFLQIYNIGPARAFDFAAEGCRSFGDLLKRPEDRKPKLSRAHRIGLEHREDIQRLIPRAEMDALKVELQETVRSVDPAFECEVLGSYRRGVPFSSDIDLAVRHPSFNGGADEEAKGKAMLESIIGQLEAKGLVKKENELMRGNKKYAGLIRLPRHNHYRRIDLRLAPSASYPYMLLGSSGDSLLMKLLRWRAKQKGWCLNEYGMGDKYDATDKNPNGFRPGTLKVVDSEREIFDLLGMPYLVPAEREYRVWGPKYLRELTDPKARDFVAKL